MSSEELTVSSEIYEENDYVSDEKPSISKENLVSKFPFRLPPKKIENFDEDGDPILERRSKENYDHCIEIEHSARTGLELVGLQVWRGALLLADWLIHNSEKLDPNKYILELGSGVGLTSIVGAFYAPVICTDIDKGGILELIQSNFKKNSKFLVKNDFQVMELDFSKATSQELKSMLSKVETIIAADVVYDDNITNHFVNKLEELLLNASEKCCAYVALEQRYVFTIDDLATSAPCYQHFLTKIKGLKSGITAIQLDTDFPKYFKYDRTKQLVLWKISR